VKSMDEIAVLMDRLETYEPTKTLQELAREMPLVPGLRLLASREQLPARHLLPRRHPSPNKRRLLLPTSKDALAALVEVRNARLTQSGTTKSRNSTRTT